MDLVDGERGSLGVGTVSKRRVEVRPTQPHKYMHARTRADTHTLTHTQKQKAFV